ncbi:MAG: heavy-metal-associated domain-containing protein [Verrucomicrobia bacterium]|nr:heavy-metal-associated domain-containing protein [Verrucomicrobiota bacterium]MCH8512177.1 heavy-metal-associated domain-containing protein [Kiritimatiellia bacterium]
MKKFLTAALGVALMTWMTGCASTGETQTDSEEEFASTTAEITAHGLSCPLCASNLDDQIKRISGVKDSRIDFETGVLHVQVKEGQLVSKSELFRAVRDAGFTPQSFRTPGEGQ